MKNVQLFVPKIENFFIKCRHFYGKIDHLDKKIFKCETLILAEFHSFIAHMQVILPRIITAQMQTHHPY